jgi:hypothetical protein
MVVSLENTIWINYLKKDFYTSHLFNASKSFLSFAKRSLKSLPFCLAPFKYWTISYYTFSLDINQAMILSPPAIRIIAEARVDKISTFMVNYDP